MYQEWIENLLAQKTIFKTADFTKAGIPRVYIKQLLDSDRLVKVDRGIYIKDWEHYDDFAIFQLKNQTVVYSYLSSLYLHELTDVIPQYFEVTVYTGYNRHRISQDVRVHYVQKEFYELGKIDVLTPMGNTVTCYDMERTICDLINSRSQIDIELFSSSLKAYLKSSQKDLRKLYQYAEALKIRQKVKEIFEVIYE